MKLTRTASSNRRACFVLAALSLISNAGCSVSTANGTQPSDASTASAASAAASEVKTNSAPLASQAEYAQVCAICHLANGEGVPGAFPPLNQRLGSYANNEAGRDFLVGLIKNGLYGAISVEGVTYNGAMPPLGSQVDAEKTAALLNYTLKTFAATKADFTASEVSTRNSNIGNTSGAALRKNALSANSE